MQPPANPGSSKARLQQSPGSSKTLANAARLRYHYNRNIAPFLRNSVPFDKGHELQDATKAQADDPAGPQPGRADARRNMDRLLRAALAVFAESGVDAPVREIAERAGVGVGTIYRHFPRRADLIAATFRRETDAFAEAADALSARLPPFDALAAWMERTVDFVATKRGLAKALHSGDPAGEGLAAYLDRQLLPALGRLLEAAAAAGEVQAGVEPRELLRAAASLCAPARDVGPEHPGRMVRLLLDGLRYRKAAERA